jgi:phage-related tail protein
MISKISSMKIIFIIGLFLGSVVSWRIQSIRIDNIQIKNEKFMDELKSEAKRAEKVYRDKINDEINKKSDADKNYQSTINNLNSDIKRLHNARSSSSFLPSPSTYSKNVDTACFDRIKFERALRQLDDGIQEIITEGDGSRIELDNARGWAKEVYQLSY